MNQLTQSASDELSEILFQISSDVNLDTFLLGYEDKERSLEELFKGTMIILNRMFLKSASTPNVRNLENHVQTIYDIYSKYII